MAFMSVNWRIVIASIATLIIFVVDLSHPVSVAIWLAYLFPLLLLETSRQRVRLLPFLVAWILLTLIDLVIGVLASPFDTVWFDRIMGLLMFSLLVFFMDRRARIQEALRRSEVRYRQLFNTMSEGFGLWEIAYDTQGHPREFRYLNVNPAFEKMMDVSLPQALGKTVREVSPPLPHEWIEAFERIAEEGSQCRIESSITCRDKHFDALAFSPDTDKVAIIFRNVTERKTWEKALLRSEERHRYAMEAAGVAGWHWDLSSAEFICTSRIESLLGVTSETIQTFPDFIEALHPEDQESVSTALLDAIDSCEECNITFRAVLPDRSLRWLLLRGQIVSSESSSPVALYGILMDITERQLWEEKITQASAELKRSNEDLERFAYIASHDLQEPLRTVRSFLQLLEKQYKGKLDERAHEYIDFAVGGAARMQNLIADLLTYSRAGTAPQSLMPVDANHALQEALDSLKDAISQSGARITAEPLPTVLADEVQITQVFQNLLGNAVKFHRDEVPPEVAVTAQRKADRWVFHIKDNGIGIDPKYRDKVFVVFQRLNAPGKYTGTGMGLPICKRIVERHGGEMSFESQPGQGSDFSFSLKAVD